MVPTVPSDAHSRLKRRDVAFCLTGPRWALPSCLILIPNIGRFSSLTCVKRGIPTSTPDLCYAIAPSSCVTPVYKCKKYVYGAFNNITPLSHVILVVFQACTCNARQAVRSPACPTAYVRRLATCRSARSMEGTACAGIRSLAREYARATRAHRGAMTDVSRSDGTEMYSRCDMSKMRMLAALDLHSVKLRQYPLS